MMTVAVVPEMVTLEGEATRCDGTAVLQCLYLRKAGAVTVHFEFAGSRTAVRHLCASSIKLIGGRGVNAAAAEKYIAEFFHRSQFQNSAVAIF